MIWAKRGAAVVVAAGLIVGAVVIRNEVIEGGDGDDTPDAAEATTLVCLTELKPLCDAASARHPELAVRIESAARTADTWSSAARSPAEVWLTVAPLPDTITAERGRTRLSPLDLTVDTLGSSQLVVAVPNAKAEALAAQCGSPLEWRCVGEVAGTPWPELGGPAGSIVRPAFAPPESAVGQLGYFGNAPVDPIDPGLITWARALDRAVSPSALSGGTPIATVQVRDSALDVAVGFDAEISNARRDRLTVLYAAPMVRVDLVLATPAGMRLPSAVRVTLAEAATGIGWGSSVAGSALTADQVAQATQLWEDLT
jgi:hypothetical protein